MKSLLIFCLLISSPLLAQDGLELLGIASSKTARASDENKCGDPHAALSKTLALGVEKSSCFEKAGFTSHELIVVAEHLVKVLKANGVDIDLRKVSHDADYRDDKSNESRYVVMDEELPIYLDKIGNQWLFPDEVIENINALYKASLHFNINWLYEHVPPWAVTDFFGIAGVNALQIVLLLAIIALALIVRFGIATVFVWLFGFMFARFHLDEHGGTLKHACYALGTLVVVGLVSAVIPSFDINVHVLHYLLIALQLVAGMAAVLLVYHSVDIGIIFLYRQARKAESKIDDQLVPLLGKVLKVVVIILGGIFVLQNLDVDVTGLLAGVTIGGLAFSFAAKDAVANFFGSVTIFSDKAFSIGDQIKIHDVEGRVEAIGFRSTRIRTESDTLISMPNSKFTDEQLENFSARRKRRTITVINLAPTTTSTQVEGFCNGIRAIIKAHPQTRKDNYLVHFDGFGEQALKIGLTFFTAVTTKPEDLRIRHEIYLDIWRLAEKMTVQIWFSSQDTNVFLQDAKPPELKPQPSREDLEKTAALFAPGGDHVIPPGPRGGEGYFAEGRGRTKKH